VDSDCRSGCAKKNKTMDFHLNFPERQLADLLLTGAVDFIEAGDCRRPGQPGALRAIATGDADRPLAIGGAELDFKLEHMQKLTLAEGLAMLRARAESLAKTVGPAGRMFTVKLRKNYAN
jgi:hypothetical protein